MVGPLLKKRFVWSDDAVETLLDLRAQGLSEGKIARAMNATSTNAISGKLHRLGIKSDRPAGRPPGIQETAPRQHRSPNHECQTTALCYAAGCFEQPKQGHFCDRHAYRPPENVQRLTARRA